MSNLREINFSIQNGTSKRVSEDELHVDAFLMYEGVQKDSRGRPFEATPEFMNALSRSYKNHIKKPNPALQAVRKMFGKDIDLDPDYAPVIKNHKKGDLDQVIGHVLDLEAIDFDGKTYLFAKLSIKGKDNIDKVEPNILKNWENLIKANLNKCVEMSLS